MATKPLQGRTALVTGGARRIGREIALSLARAGANVAITNRDSKNDAAGAASEFNAIGVESLLIECDVRSESSVRSAIASVISRFNRLDILVNNAAIFQSASLDSLTLDQWDDVFETNARGPFLVSREAIGHLRATRGRIINIGSLGGLHAWAGHAHYCASKAAVHMLTQAMAKAWAPDIAVTCVAPGWIEMDEHPSEAALRFASKTPMQRNGSASDVAEAVLFFATSPTFITGQILAVDGGLGLA